MKPFLKQILITLLALWLVASLTPSLGAEPPFPTLPIAAFWLTIFHTLVKPFLKILILPLNVVTLGLIGWLVNLGLLYLVTLLVPGLALVPFNLTLGELSLYFSPLIAAFLTALLIELTRRFFHWLLT